MSARTPDAEPLLTPAEVATMFRVDPKTVTRWAKAGKLTSIRTLGGHRRYRESEVRALLAGTPNQRTEGVCPRLHPPTRCAGRPALTQRRQSTSVPKGRAALPVGDAASRLSGGPVRPPLLIER